MDILKFWWLALILGLAGIILLALLSNPRSAKRGQIVVAYTKRLTRLPGFAKRRTQLVLGAVASFLVVLLAGASALVGIARPATVETINPALSNRDIMLCLDASGSMAYANEGILEEYKKVIDSFNGERIGMTIFNNVAVSVFPLTTDYQMAKDYIDELIDGISSYGYSGLDPYDGTVDPNIDGSSLVGDGLVSCVNNFDLEDEERPRSVIFATDNGLEGTPLFQLSEAIDFAVEKDVKVYAIGPSGIFNQALMDELEREVERAGGSYFEIGMTGGIDRLVREIQAEEAAQTDGQQVTLIHDHPLIPLALTTFGLIAVFVLAWRFKL